MNTCRKKWNKAIYIWFVIFQQQEVKYRLTLLLLRQKISLSLSLCTLSRKQTKKKMSWNLFFFISYYLLSKKIVGVKTLSFGHDLISVQMGIRIG
jgi:hypothetical protein